MAYHTSKHGLLFSLTSVSRYIWREVACLLRGPSLPAERPTVCQSPSRMKERPVAYREKQP